MTDSSSKDELADITAELIHSKMENARASTQMTHVLRIGSFHMELVPAPEIDAKEMFNEILDKLMDRYDDKLLEGHVEKSEQRHYG